MQLHIACCVLFLTAFLMALAIRILKNTCCRVMVHFQLVEQCWHRTVVLPAPALLSDIGDISSRKEVQLFVKHLYSSFKKGKEKQLGNPTKVLKYWIAIYHHHSFLMETFFFA